MNTMTTMQHQGFMPGGARHPFGDGVGSTESCRNSIAPVVLGSTTAFNLNAYVGTAGATKFWTKRPTRPLGTRST